MDADALETRTMDKITSKPIMLWIYLTFKMEIRGVLSLPLLYSKPFRQCDCRLDAPWNKHFAVMCDGQKVGEPCLRVVDMVLWCCHIESSSSLEGITDQGMLMTIVDCH